MKIKKLFVLFLIFIVLMPTYVLARENSSLDSTISYINNQIYKDLNITFSTTDYIKMYFYDDYSSSYRVIYINRGNLDSCIGMYDDLYSDLDNLYNVIMWIGNQVAVYLYTVPFDGSTCTSESYWCTGGTYNLNTMFNLSCLNSFTYMYGEAVGWSQAYKFDTWNETLSKSITTIPYLSYNSDSFIIDGNIIINPADTTLSNDVQMDFIFECMDVETYEVEFRFLLNRSSSYFDSTNNVYKISLEDLSFYLTENNDYLFSIELFNNNNFYYKEELVTVSWDGTNLNPNNPDVPDDGDNENEDTSTSQIVGSIGTMSNEITSGLNEVNETNKGIWESIKEVISYINPFSENFFVYKLIDLLLDMLKSLFIPSDDFFTNWLDDLNSYFGNTFGILYYPFEILINFLNRIDTIDSTSPVINVPNFDIEFMGYKATFIKGFSYDFNSLLVNDTFKTIHTIYLGVVDIILWLSVVYVANKCIKSILGGMGDEVISNVSSVNRSEDNKENKN